MGGRAEKRALAEKKLDELEVYVVNGLLVKTFSTHCDFYKGQHVHCILCSLIIQVNQPPVWFYTMHQRTYGFRFDSDNTG